MGKHYTFPILFLLLFLLSALAYTTGLGGSSNALMRNILYVIAPAFTVFFSFRTALLYGFRTTPGKAFLFLTLGFGGWLVGELLWTYYEFVLSIDPYPSFADYFYLLGYPFLFMGFIWHIRFFGKNKQNSMGSTNFLPFVTLNTVLLTAGSLFAYYAFQSDVPILENIIFIFYVEGDVILFFILFMILSLCRELAGKTVFFPWLLLLIGFFFLFIADGLFALFQHQYELLIPVFKRIDLLWIAGYYICSWSFLSFSATAGKKA